MSYRETVQYLYNLQQYGIKFGLDNIKKLLSALGNPQNAFSALHIAGTNGKGSTSAVIASILRSTGLRVGLFTSPHLISFTERIRINGDEIPEHDVIELAEEIRKTISQFDGFSPTFFEVVTAMALLFFKRNNVDIAVMEVGMGGRLDATNIITPEVSVITNISIDHKAFLGATIGEIAHEKAGIIKEKVPVVVSSQRDEARAAIAKIAADADATVFLYGRDFSSVLTHDDISGICFDYTDGAMTIPGLSLPLPGMHQMENASVAIKAATIALHSIHRLSSPSPTPSTKGRDNRFSSLPLSGEMLERVSIPSPIAGEDKGEGDNKSPCKDYIHFIREGLRNVKWPGRLEFISENPPVLIDGAHNPAAAAALATALKRSFLEKYKKIIMILGIMHDKDIEGIMEPLLPVASDIIVTAPAGLRAARPERLAGAAASLGFHMVRVAHTVKEAIDLAAQTALPLTNHSAPLIVVTGSFYTIGEAKEVFGQKGVLGRLRE